MSQVLDREVLDKGYAVPDVLVSTHWVADRLNDADVRIIESNEDPLLYPSGHIPGAAHVDWTNDLNDPVRRDYINREAFERLMSRIGVTPQTTVVFYGDKSNWWATYAFWVFQLFNHRRAKVMDGGRLKWEKEGRPMTRDIPGFEPTRYQAPERKDSDIRAFHEDVLEHFRNRRRLVDVRSREEYTGERLHMEGYPNEGALRGGHIPGAANVPWSRAANPADGTFRPARELKDIYLKEQDLKPEEPVIAYCRIGERSSHTWFVLKYLLGFKDVKNYDGSWTEWGNLVNVPIER